MLNDDKRGKWRSIGRNIWMTVRSNPECFRDHVEATKRLADTKSEESAWKKRRHMELSQDPGRENSDVELDNTSILEQQRHRAASS
eukprot:6071897-Ditylum_brightwellii.AAC.1